MKRITYWIRDYFGFNQQETKGFLVLMTLLVIVLLCPLLFSPSSNYTAEQREVDKQMLDSMQVLLAKQDIQPAERKQFAKKWEKSKPTPNKTFDLKPFDPNTASSKELISLGLADYLAERIIKYRSKGGTFHQKSDLLKIYGFPEWLYKKWEPYILLPEKEDKSVSHSAFLESNKHEKLDSFEVSSNTESLVPPKRKFTIIPFDLATADTTQLKQIKGIGSKLSARIVGFRDKLGGFYALDQLNEVYGLKPEVIAELLKYAHLKSPQIRKIEINSADIKSLAVHPYISYKLARVIVNYREQHGNYMSIQDLEKVKLIKKDFIQKIQPYLNF